MNWNRWGEDGVSPRETAAELAKKVLDGDFEDTTDVIGAVQVVEFLQGVADTPDVNPGIIQSIRMLYDALTRNRRKARDARRVDRINSW